MKRCVLSFLRKLVRDEISLMSNGSASRARGPAIRGDIIPWHNVL